MEDRIKQGLIKLAALIRVGSDLARPITGRLFGPDTEWIDGKVDACSLGCAILATYKRKPGRERLQRINDLWIRGTYRVDEQTGLRLHQDKIPYPEGTRGHWLPEIDYVEEVIWQLNDRGWTPDRIADYLEGLAKTGWTVAVI